MKVAKVLGTVVATEKHPDYDGLKLLVVQPLDEHLKPAGDSLLAVDTVQAGKGDIVLILREGTGIRQIFSKRSFAVRSAIVGIVDEVDTAI